MNRHPQEENLIPQTQLLNLITGSLASQIIYTSVRLGLIDHIYKGIGSKKDLASSLGTREHELSRLLAAIEALGLVNGCARDAIELTDMGEQLRTDKDGSLQPLARLFAQDWHIKTWNHLLDRMSLDKPAFDHLMGVPLFEYLQNAPDDRVLFDNAMDSLSLLWGPAVVERMDLSNVKTLVDIGGGRGIFLAEILLQHPHVKGCLFDLPEAIEQARTTPGLHDYIAHGRCELAEGSFFSEFPGKADAHSMKFIMHDWGDEEALNILQNSRHSLSKDGTLFIIDQIVDPARRSPFTHLSDIEMLLFGNGRERTADEFARLLERAGFTMDSISETATPFSIIQAKLSS